MRKKLAAMLLAVVMAFSLLPLSACSGGATAATMHLRRTEGTVAVSDSGGKDVPLLDNLGLYSGYRVGTRSASYAWIDLDDVKLTKMDQNSEISIEKEGKALDIQLKSGSLYFNVTEPLGDDETMNIRTSTMLVGIRGTSGWVEERSGLSRVYILEGRVECSAEGQTVQVSAREMAELTLNGQLVVEPFTAEDIPAFVRDDADPDLISGVEKAPGPDAAESPAPSEPPEPSEFPEPSESPGPSSRPAGEVLVSGSCGENVTWTLYSDGTLTIDGTGNMDDYWADYERPWNDYSREIRTVVIGDGVTSITWYAFKDFTSLTDVTIGSGVKYITPYAFSDCPSLTSVVIPDGVSSIGMAAFWGTGLTSVTIPASVISIDEGAFDVLWNGTDTPDLIVYYGGSEAQWGEIRSTGINGPFTFAEGGDMNACLYGVTVYFAVTDSGAEPPAGGNPSSPINLTISGGNYSIVDDPPVYTNDMLYDWETDDYRYKSLDGCFALSPEAQLTVSNLANADDNCYIDDIWLWTLEQDYTYNDYENNCYLDSLYFYHLTNNEGFIPHMMYSNPEYGDRLVQLRPGESVTFSISEYVTLYDDTEEAFLTYDLLVLAVYLIYPDAGQSEIVYYGFVFNE